MLIARETKVNEPLMIFNLFFLHLTAKLDANDDAGYDACLQSNPNMFRNIVACKQYFLNQSPQGSHPAAHHRGS